MKKTLALAVVASLAIGGLARAAGPDPIAVRQAGQFLMYGDFTGMNTVVAAKGDVTKLEKPAKAIARWMKVFPTLFPPGSDKGEHTKAKPDIWSDHADFVKAADKLGAAAAILAKYAHAGDRAKVAAQLRVMGEDCKACHRRFVYK